MSRDSLVLSCHGITRAGATPSNGDAMLVGTGADPMLFAIADGMGGPRGAAASSLAITVLADLNPGGSLGGAFMWANCEIFEKRRAGAANGAPAKVGVASLVALRFPYRGSAVELVHVGDSRAYLLRGGVLGPLTEDHSLVPMPARRCAASGARGPVRRHLVARALGRSAEVRVDSERVDARPGDRFVLCSDGLSDLVCDGEMSRVLGRTAGGSQTAAWELAAAAVRAGTEDDLTVVVVDVVAATTDPVVAAEPVNLGVSGDR